MFNGPSDVTPLDFPCLVAGVESWSYVRKSWFLVLGLRRVVCRLVGSGCKNVVDVDTAGVVSCACVVGSCGCVAGSCG